jgi:hypothetical protein
MFLGAVSQKTEMTDAHEAIRQDMEQKPADKLLGIQSHRFQPIFVFAVPVGEPPLALGKSHDLERCTFLGPDRRFDSLFADRQVAQASDISLFYTGFLVPQVRG